jgi:molecular chaperone DnaK
VEGDHERADRNRLVGLLEIRGEHIKRDLPAGSKIEVTLRIDESRIITVSAYVPFLDEDFQTKIDMKASSPKPDVLKREYEAEMKRFREVRARVTHVEDDATERLVRSVEQSPLIREVEELVATAQGNADAALKCEKRLLELKLTFDEAMDALEWPSLVAETRRDLDRMKELTAASGSRFQRDRAAELAGEIEDLIRERKMSGLRSKREQTRRLTWEIIFAQPGFWVDQLQRMEKERTRMTDQARVARLIEQGRDCIAKNNAAALENVVRQIWDLLPGNIVEAAQRGYQSGLAR